MRYVFSQYLFLVSIGCIFIVHRFIPGCVDSGAISSAPVVKPWNESDDPVLFGHLTDVHVNSYDRTRSFKLPIALSHYANLSIRTLLVTGDLADNWGNHSWGRFGDQQLSDYLLYEELLSGYISSFDNLIDLPGNHDAFGLFTFDSPSHFALKYSHFLAAKEVRRVEDFWAAIVRTDDVWFVTITPIRFPNPHGLIDCWVRSTTQILDAIEAALGQIGPVHPPIVVASHFPVSFWNSEKVRSSTGKSFRAILAECNTTIYLAGHAHVKQSMYFHYDGLLEAIGRDLFEHDGWSVVTIDNGRPFHHSYGITENPIAILTHPIPVNQLSRAIPFNERTTAIRILAPSKTLNITVAGSTSGRMELRRQLANGLFLYSLPLENLTAGRHELSFRGDWEFDMEFFVGDSLPHFSEPLFPEWRLLGTVRFAALLIAVLGFVVLWPVDVPRLAIGPRARLLLLPRWLRNWLFVGHLAPLFLPISFLTIEGHMGIIFWYGFWIDGEVYWDVWGQALAALYQAGFVFGMAVVAAGVAVSRPWRRIFVVDYLFALGTAWGTLHFYRNTITEAVGIGWTWLSPLFVFAPPAFYLPVIAWGLQRRLSKPRRE